MWHHQLQVQFAIEQKHLKLSVDIVFQFVEDKISHQNKVSHQNKISYQTPHNKSKSDGDAIKHIIELRYKKYTR